MPEEQVPSSEAPSTLLACEWLFLRMRSLVPLKMFKTSEPSIARGANMWPWLIRFRRREIRVDGILRAA